MQIAPDRGLNVHGDHVGFTEVVTSLVRNRLINCRLSVAKRQLQGCQNLGLYSLRGVMERRAHLPPKSI